MNSAPGPAKSEPAGDIGAGQVLGRYELLMPIASGGMAMVWAARLKGTRGFEKIVAIKTMLPKLSEDEQFESMFLDEARLASQVRHPHVVEIMDLGEHDGVLFLVMEWIDGVPLNQLMKAARSRGGVPISVAVRVAMQACAGLHAAHELKDKAGQLVGLVHRDVSPQNVLVTYDGVTKVVDFGVAKATAAGSGATLAGQIKGKVAYMAPEQIKGHAIDRRVDIFAMGIVLYALTTGKHPFRRETEANTMYNICAPQPVVPPRKVRPDYPPQLERILVQALAKDPDRRFKTANDLLRALDQLPAQLRASTDDEVGEVVRDLLGERRQARRQALDDAIERANRNPVVPDWGSSEASRSGASAVSLMTRGVSGGAYGSAVDTGVPLQGTGVTGTLVGQTSLRRRLVIGAGVAAALLLGVGVFASLRSSTSAPTGDRAKAQGTGSADDAEKGDHAQSRGASRSSATEVGPAGEKGATDAGAADASSDKAKTTDTEASSAVPRWQPSHTRTIVSPRTGTQPKPGSAGAVSGSTRPNWKHDPGF